MFKPTFILRNYRNAHWESVLMEIRHEMDHKIAWFLIYRLKHLEDRASDDIPDVQGLTITYQNG